MIMLWLVSSPSAGCHLVMSWCVLWFFKSTFVQLLVSRLIYFDLFVQTFTQLVFLEYFYIHPRLTSMLNDVVLMKPQGRGFAPR